MAEKIATEIRATSADGSLERALAAPAHFAAPCTESIAMLWQSISSAGIRIPHLIILADANSVARILKMRQEHPAKAMQRAGLPNLAQPADIRLASTL
jgi:hypothetical protein